jgi:hypothetical protein
MKDGDKLKCKKCNSKNIRTTKEFIICVRCGNEEKRK